MPSRRGPSRKRRAPRTAAGHRAGRSRQAVSRTISAPIAGADAFTSLSDPRHVLSQAATLLLIGSALRGDAAAIEVRARARAGQTAEIAPVEALPSEDLYALGFPTLTAGTSRFRAEHLQRAAGVRFAPTRTAVPAPSDTRAAARRLRVVATAFYRDASVETAAALLEVGLRHPSELARVAAAASYVEVTVDPEPAIRVLERALRSRDRLTRDVAAHALARVDPYNPSLAKLMESRRGRSRRPPSHTSLIVHGTFGQNADWWQPPAGDFWKYLHDNVDPALYGAGDRFDWSGGYSDFARALGGSQLHAWVQAHALDGLDVFTHSHGGSVAMLASHAGTAFGRMVLLSCPVHWDKYTPDFVRVGRVVSIRVHLDLVILVDGGGQRFRDPRITEHVLPIWFDHFATHDPGTWERYNVRAMI